jgi:hypothetical protein
LIFVCACDSVHGVNANRAHIRKNPVKRISGAHRPEQRKASITGKRDEMKMAVPVVANDFVGRGEQEKSKPRPFKPERVGHPEQQNQSLGVDHPEQRNQSLRVDVLKWYHPTVLAGNKKNTKGWATRHNSPCEIQTRCHE